MAIRKILAMAAFLAMAIAQSNLCIQGCCDLKLELPSSQVRLIPASDSQKNGQSIGLGAAELKCCPCADVEEAKSVPKNNFAILCPEGQPCGEWCVCTDGHGRKDWPHQQLRPLCEAGKCSQKTCLCREELLQGFHDLFFGKTGDPSGSKTVKSWNVFADMLGLGKKEHQAENKEEL